MSFIAPQGAQAGLALLLSPASSSIILRSGCALVGTVYPVFESMKAVESQKADEADVQWLTYWSVYGALCLVEGVSDNLLGWFPYYYHAKLCFLLWLMLPRYQGARTLYKTYARPLFLQYRDKVDGVLQRVKSHLEEYLAAHEGDVKAVKGMYAKVVEFLQSPSTKGD